MCNARNLGSSPLARPRAGRFVRNCESSSRQLVDPQRLLNKYDLINHATPDCIHRPKRTAAQQIKSQIKSTASTNAAIKRTQEGYQDIADTKHPTPEQAQSEMEICRRAHPS